MNVDELGSMELLTIAGGSISVSLLITMLLQVVKDYAPNLSGRQAVSAVYGVSGFAALVVLIVQEASPFEPLTYIAWFVLTLWASIIARGIYATMFRAAS